MHYSVPDYLMGRGKNPFGIFIDIDGLVWINDYYGFIAGDSAIQQVATTLNELANSNDAQLFRISGDEFVIILPDETSNFEAYDIAKTALKVVADLKIEYQRQDDPSRKELAVNAVISRLTSNLLERIDDVRKWIADEIWIAKEGEKLCCGVIRNCGDTLPQWAH